MDKEVREKIHFLAAYVLEPGGIKYCNCGLRWPCPVLAVYEDADRKNAAPPGLYEKGEHHWEWESGSMDYVVQFCMHCGKFKEDLEKLDPMPKCPGPSIPPPPTLESFLRTPPGFSSFEIPTPARPAVFIWRCACGTLNDYKVGETPFCSGCRTENPVADAVYTIEEARHWPMNLRR